MENQLIPAILSFISTVFTGVMAYFLAKLNRTANDIHTLTNSNMGAQLKLTAVAARRIAVFTKDADDISAAEEAERLLKDHVSKQAAVDSGVNK